jgi:hypothetical protein
MNETTKEADVGSNATKADLSFDEIRRLVQGAIQSGGSSDLYVCELYDDRAIYEQFGDSMKPGSLWEVPYTIDDAGEVTLGDRTEVKRETVYTAVKFADGTDGMIEGLAIPYLTRFKGGDVQGERFSKATDLCLDWFPEEGRPFLFHHGVDRTAKAVAMGRQVEREELDVGQWVKVQLDKRSKYLKGLQELVDQGALQFSSGALPHLVRTDRKTGQIWQWPWVELSGTPTPAELEASVYAVKSADAIDHLKAVHATAALKSILESEGGSESEPFAVLADRIATDLDAFAVRAELRRDWRAKAGRGISAANRAEIAEIVESLRPLGETYTRLTDLLARTDPDATEASKAAEQEYLRFLREQARQNGVQVGAE